MTASAPESTRTQAGANMVVVIEPAGGNTFGGGMREKLAVFTRRLEERSIPYHVFTWLPAIEKYPAVTAVSETPAAKWLRFVPRKYAVKALEFLTYRAAFAFAVKNNAPVMGLTISVPWALIPARWGLDFTTPFVERILYVGLHGSGDQLKVKKRIMGALQIGLGRNGIAAFTTNFQNEMFVKHQPFHPTPPTASYLIPEFILYDMKISWSKERDNVLLIVGADELRRTPVKHLLGAGLKRPFSKILLHVPGTNERDEKALAALRESAAAEVVWSNDYIIGDELLERFSRAKYCLVAYAPFFTATSSILLQSILCGLPVLASKFPDSEYMAKTFGKYGEFFEYENSESFRDALARLLAWTDRDWDEFLVVRQKVIDYCGYDRGIDRCLELMGWEKA